MSSPSRVLPQLVMVLALGAGLVRAQAPPAQLPAQACPAEQKNARLPDLRFASQYYKMAYQEASQPTVVMEIRVLHVGDDLFEDFVQGCKLKKQHSLIVDECSATAFLKQVQDDEDSWVVAAPTLSTFSGHTANLRVGEDQNFVTDMQVVRCANQTVYVPKSEPYHTGCTMCIRPAVTPDGQNVVMHFQAECAEMPDGEPPMFPVTTMISPVFEGGAMGQPVPFTQFLQQPMVSKRCMTAALGVPVGKTAMIYGGHSVQTVHDVSRVPFLADLPLIGCLFENVDEREVSDHLVYMVTPRVVTGDEESCHQDGQCCCPNGPCHWRAAAQAMQICPAPCCDGTICCMPMPMVPVAGVCQMQCPMQAAPPVPSCQLPQFHGMMQILPGVNFEICLDHNGNCPCPANCQCAVPCPCPANCCPAGCPQCPTQCAQCPMACPATGPQCPGNGNCCAATSCAAVTCQAQAVKCPGPCCLPAVPAAPNANAQVKLETRIVKIDEEFFTRPENAAWSDFTCKTHPAYGHAPHFVDRNVAERFLQCVQAQNCGHVLSQPQMLTLDGQQTEIQCAARSHDYTAHVTLQATPRLSADNRFCRIGWLAQIRECPAADEQSVVPLGPVSSSDSVVSVPFGQTVFSYVVGASADHNCYLVMLTPSIQVPSIPLPTLVQSPQTCTMPTPVTHAVWQVNQPAPAANCCPTELTLPVLMRSYREACAAGRLVEARVLAERCLQMDPTCFGRN